MLVGFEIFIMDLTVVLDTFETHPSEFLEVEYFVIIIKIIIIKRTSV